jgi:signal transduction histidine kinase
MPTTASAAAAGNAAPSRAGHDDARLDASPLLVVALWTIPALLSTFETVMFASQGPAPISVWRAFASEAPGWYVWAALTVPIIRLGQRFPLDRRLTSGTLLVHVAAFVTVAAAQAAVSAAVGLALRPGRLGFLRSFEAWFLSGLPFTVLVYAAVLGISYTLLNRARLQARERHAAELTARLTEARLGALRMQLQPHFLFNSLNAVTALVRDPEVDRAVRALTLLGDVLRETLRAETDHEIALDDELAFIQRYLEIERVRFGEKLRVSIDVPDALRGAMVPTFVLQPFVENALRHGLAPRRGGGTVEISAAEARGALTLSVRDDGQGLAPDWEKRAAEGVGIANARARLAWMYGGAASVTIAAAEGRGTEVSIVVPLRRARAAVEARSDQSLAGVS